MSIACLVPLFLIASLAGQAQAPPTPPTTAPLAPDPVGPSRNTESELRDLVERFTLDRAALLRRYPVESSPERYARLKRYYTDWQARVDAIDFELLSVEGRIDHLMMRARLAYLLRVLDREQHWRTETTTLLPFAGTVVALNDARLRMETHEPEKAAATLDALAAHIDDTRRAVEAGLNGGSGPRTPADTNGSNGSEGTNGPAATRAGAARPTPIKTTKLVAFRAQGTIAELAATLKTWSDFYRGYDPLFGWWADAPYKKVTLALDVYRKVLRERAVGIKAGEDEPIVGAPIGREALAADLRSEFIAYTPEELIAIGEREFAWCETEMKRAARDMGFPDDWKGALEKVKTLHVPPGKQAELIRDQAREAEAYVAQHDLITVPPLAKEIWRMTMMSPERQKVNPFFTGGEVISVSFPTDAMDHDDKLMSMRGNNIHFARATVHHELIPGHHLQGFMTARYNSHRLAFSTPFWGEGWALYWEMLLWDLGFPETPENRVGMLFWRMHRAARIIFSLRFHLGTWTPEQCIDFLVDRVGHERANAEAEVRRSFNGTYPPLYQLAYMMGGLQFRALHQELVGTGTKPGAMTNRQFHDAILTGGTLPVELVRARLTQQRLARDHQASWKFPQGGFKD
jgi:uncharacterized protein (DUF885 family)